MTAEADDDRPTRAAESGQGPGGFFERTSVVSAIDGCWAHGPAPAHVALIAADASVDVIVRMPARARERVPTPFVSAATDRAMQVEVLAGEIVMGVRLRPGFGGPLQALSADRVYAAAAPFSRDPSLDSLEGLVGSLLDEIGPPPAVVRELLALSSETSGAARLTTGSPTAERALQRASRKWLGLSAKRLLRIERVRAARRLLTEGVSAAEVAAALAFADQAHLCREYRHLLGTTPGRDQARNSSRPALRRDLPSRA